MRLKSLLPSLREKKRYVAFEVQGDRKLEFKDAKDILECSIKEFIGDLGMARAGVLFLKDWKNNKGIIKVNTRYVNEIKGALALIKEHKVQSLFVSGSIEKVRRQCF
jgi:ribonuclease P/MRP protein subunit POP5